MISDCCSAPIFISIETPICTKCKEHCIQCSGGRMKAINDNQCVNGLLKGTSADVVNVPHKLIKELGWKIHQPVEIRISDCSNTESQEWQEITIMKQEDVDMVYGEEE